MVEYNSILINGLQVLGSGCPYVSNLYNFLFDSENNNNNSELFSNGEYVGNYKTNARTFTLVSNTRKENDIAAKLQLTHILNQGIILLEADIVGFGKVEANVIKESVVTDDYDTMTITFKIPEACIYKGYKSLILEKKIDGGFTLPVAGFTIPVAGFTVSEALIGNLGECLNDGYTVIYPEINIEGNGKDFVIKNNTTGEVLKINYTIETGEIIEIDCRKASRRVSIIKDKTALSILKHKYGSYISLIPGSNALEIEYEGEVTVTVKYRECYE